MIEIIAMTIDDAKKIEYCGADRIELVSSLSEGGLTPSWALIKNIINAVKIPVNVMIRPHSKSFIYTNEEIAIMKEDIIIAKELGANGVVFGTIGENGSICIKSLENILKVCDGIDITFHRAIDELKNPIEGIKILSNYPLITNVLTSGGKGNILDNISIINEMIKYRKHINIMVGGGLKFNNIEQIIKNTSTNQYHFGTAVRYNGTCWSDIDDKSLKMLVNIIKERS